jgi:hypothetical protein
MVVGNNLLFSFQEEKGIPCHGGYVEKYLGERAFMVISIERNRQTREPSLRLTSLNNFSGF